MKGTFSETDKISPSYINLKNPKYLEIDNLYYAGLVVVNYYREQNDILLKTLIETNINMNISIFYEKQDSYKVIKDLTYHIGNVGVELKENNQNRQDIDIAVYSTVNSLVFSDVSFFASLFLSYETAFFKEGNTIAENMVKVVFIFSCIHLFINLMKCFVTVGGHVLQRFRVFHFKDCNTSVG